MSQPQPGPTVKLPIGQTSSHCPICNKTVPRMVEHCQTAHKP